MAKTNGKLPSTNGVDTLHVTIWTPDDQEVVGVVQILRLFLISKTTLKNVN